MKNVWLLVLLVFITTGCRSLLPTEKVTPENHWATYEDAEAAFSKIIPYSTTEPELKAIGFDIHAPNIKVMTYLDVVQRFLITPAILKEDLPPAIQECLKCREDCKGYELAIEATSKKRYGNVPLDMLGFKKNTHITGWSFRAFIVIQGNVVTYKLASGEPNIDKKEKKGKPLGPFQEMEGVVGKIPGLFGL